MYSSPGCLAGVPKQLAKDGPLALFLATPAKQPEPLYMLFNCGIRDYTQDR